MRERGRVRARERERERGRERGRERERARFRGYGLVCRTAWVVLTIVGCESGERGSAPVPSASTVANAPSSTPTSQPSSSSPRVHPASAVATLKKYQEATTRADFKTQFQLYTPLQQEMRLARVLGFVLTHPGPKKVVPSLPRPAPLARRQRVNALLQLHDVDPIEHPTPLPGARLGRQLSAVKDRAQLYAELQALAAEPLELEAGRVVQLKHGRVAEVRKVVEAGEEATAEVVLLLGDGEERAETAKLRRVDGAWLISTLPWAARIRVVTQ